MAVASGLALVGFVDLVAGGFMHIPALRHLRPEFRNVVSYGHYWFPNRYLPEGQRLFRRARSIQLAGVGLMAVALLVRVVLR